MVKHSYEEYRDKLSFQKKKNIEMEIISICLFFIKIFYEIKFFFTFVFKSLSY